MTLRLNLKLSILPCFLAFLLVSCSKDKVSVSTPPNCPDTVSFNNEVLPIIQNNCSGCHSAGNGTGYIFTNHGNIAASADAILGSMRGNGYQLMPEGGPALPDSLIQKVECWIFQGKLNN
ncbi:MAG: hypothetical protein RL737_2028 [Bacteroidota bacterium]|jgi:hypothetical protein